MAPVIEVRDLAFVYDDGTRALDGVTFELNRGECVALLGGNGSGKTTFALHLNGLLQGTGSVRVCGLEVEKANLSGIRRKVGMVFQDSDEQLFMPTVIEDVMFGPLNMGDTSTDAERVARDALARVGMAGVEHRAPYHLSAGQKRRVALAGVLAMEPEILVLDEPTTFLDPPAERSLAKLLGELPQAKILITHDMPFARKLATRAVFFERGRIAGEGTVDELAARFHWSVDLP